MLIQHERSGLGFILFQIYAQKMLEKEKRRRGRQLFPHDPPKRRHIQLWSTIETYYLCHSEKAENSGSFLRKKEKRKKKLERKRVESVFRGPMVTFKDKKQQTNKNREMQFTQKGLSKVHCNQNNVSFRYVFQSQLRTPITYFSDNGVPTSLSDCTPEGCSFAIFLLDLDKL